MDVVKTYIQKLNGNIEIKSVQGKGSSFVISLPLTLAILPVLLVSLGDQPFAVPLSMVREILPIDVTEVQEVGGRIRISRNGRRFRILHATVFNLLDQTGSYVGQAATFADWEPLD
jgi:two-component system chemotaxis sensor kinase CheA